jgi:hypothetical protein
MHFAQNISIIMHNTYVMPNEDDRIRVNGRVPKDLYEELTKYYSNITLALNDAVELLVLDKNGGLHKDCRNNMQNDAGSIQAQIAALEAQINLLKAQVEMQQQQLNVKDAQLEKQAVHIQSLIQENSKLNIKLLPENTKKPWYKFWL